MNGDQITLARGEVAQHKPWEKTTWNGYNQP